MTNQIPIIKILNKNWLGSPTSHSSNWSLVNYDLIGYWGLGIGDLNNIISKLKI